jgi:hypothetical protein
MGVVNFILNAAGDLVMMPLRVETAWPGIIAFSILVAILAMVTYKYTSNQVALRDARNRLLARVLEIRLYQDDILGIFGIILRILASSFFYIKESLRPLLVMIVPVSLILIQMAAWFEYRPLEPGNSAILSVKCDEAIDVLSVDMSATAGDGLVLETDALRAPKESVVSWRIGAKTLGDSWVDVSLGDVVLRKQIRVANGLQKVSPKRVRAQLWDSLLYPVEPFIGETSPMQSISLSYPKRQLYAGHLRVDWVVAFFVLTLAFGLLLKPILRVEL